MKNKLASMAIAGLAVTAFAACGDDDGGDTPDDTSLIEDTSLTGDTTATEDTSAETMAPATTAGG